MCLNQGDIERPSSLATDKICFSTEKKKKKVGGNNHVTRVMWTPKIVNSRTKWSDKNNPSAFYG